jgi:hypothetical protein
VELIMVCYAGSHLYGLNTPESDIDIRGVCYSPASALLGLTGFEQWHPGSIEAIAWSKTQLGVESSDIQIFALNKFFSLCLQANPNILEMLFVPDSLLLCGSIEWGAIVDRRDMFLSTKAIHTFAGYAYSQLIRIRNHKRWLDKPPIKPDPAAFGLTTEDNGAQVWSSVNLKNKYENLLADWQAYSEWRSNRNPARAALEEKFGIDTKFAGHVVRLVREGEELLTTGYITLPLPPIVREEINAVKNGEVPYEDIVKLAEGIKDKLLAISSSLPRTPNFTKAEQMLIDLQGAHLTNKKNCGTV